MSEKDWDYIAKVEKAIKQKYGSGAIVNPKALWNPEKEKKYLESLKKIQELEISKSEEKSKLNVKGVLISKNLISKESRESCPVCEVYSFNTKDDFYFTRFRCCFDCYIEFVEEREDRWQSGWRPDKEKIKSRRE